VVRENDITESIDRDKFQYLILCYFDDDKKQELLGGWQTIKKIKIYDSLAGYKEFPAVDLFYLVKFSDLKNSGLKKLFNLSYHGPHFEIYKLFNDTAIQ
jgi:hypothetical protein